MQKFRHADGTEGIIYETLEELLQLSNIRVSEYSEKYYVEILEDSPCYSTVYEVNKRNNKAIYMEIIDYMLDIEDKATPIDPETLRRAS